MNEEDAIDWGEGALDEEQEALVSLETKDHNDGNADTDTVSAADVPVPIVPANEVEQVATVEQIDEAKASDSAAAHSQSSSAAEKQRSPLTLPSAEPFTQASKGNGAVQSTAPISLENESRTLPAGWKVKLSRSNEFYYVNNLTGFSTWDRPTEAAEPANGAKSDVKEEKKTPSSNEPTAKGGIQIRGAAKGVGQRSSEAAAAGAFRNGDAHAAPTKRPSSAVPLSRGATDGSTNKRRKPVGRQSSQDTPSRAETDKEKQGHGRKGDDNGRIPSSTRKSPQLPTSTTTQQPSNKKGWGRDMSIASAAASPQYRPNSTAPAYGSHGTQGLHDTFRPERQAVDKPYAAHSARLAGNRDVLERRNAPSEHVARPSRDEPQSAPAAYARTEAQLPGWRDSRVGNARGFGNTSTSSMSAEPRHSATRGNDAYEQNRSRNQGEIVRRRETERSDDRRSPMTGAQRPTAQSDQQTTPLEGAARWPDRRASNKANSGWDRERDTGVRPTPPSGAANSNYDRTGGRRHFEASQQPERAPIGGRNTAPRTRTPPTEHAASRRQSERQQDSSATQRQQGTVGNGDDPDARRENRWPNRSERDNARSGSAAAAPTPPAERAAPVSGQLSKRERELRDREEAIARRERELGLRT